MAKTIDPQTAWQPYTPTADNPWDLQKVGHVYRRAAFGASWADLQAGLKARAASAHRPAAQGRTAVRRSTTRTRKSS